MKKYGIFFGAGAEKFYGLPTGAEYVVDTILTKKDNLYDALKIFYENRMTSDYVNKYRADFLFRENSIAFQEIIWRAAQKINGTPSTSKLSQDEKNIVKLCPKDADFSKRRPDFSTQCKEVYNKIIKCEKVSNETDANGNANNMNPYENLCNHFSYYGTVEKDFATILDPKDAGEVKFWRLINYFWSAFFSIVMPIIYPKKENESIREYTKEMYIDVLDDLKGCLNRVQNYVNTSEMGSYYSQFFDLQENQKPECILTTNYTSFVESIEISSNKYAYLAGKLSWFEIPNKLKICDILDESNCQIEETDFIFPFIMTQAPIKPIINPIQIEEYANAMKYLSEIETLVIVGYSLGRNDEHINSLLNWFLKDNEKKIIYCEYHDKQMEFDAQSSIEYVSEQLRIKDAKSNSQIEAIWNDGDPANLRKKIIRELSQLD